MRLTVGSLFSGIGGLEVGFERTGRFTVRWQVEQDPFCLAVLNRHWPDVARYTDVREVGAHNLEPVDVLVGGFPCQDVSDAGKRVGIDGERSGLWAEYARLIRELRPRFAVMENVRGLLVRGLDRVLGDLADIGYDAEWTCLRASDVGAPHRRERIFILAYPQCDGRERRGDARDVLRSGGEAESGEARQRQRERDAARNRGAAVADAADDRREQRGPSHDDDGRDARRHVADRRSPVADASRGRLGVERDAAFARHGGHADGSDESLADAAVAGLEGDLAGTSDEGDVYGRTARSTRGTSRARVAVTDAFGRERRTDDEGEQAAGREWATRASHWLGWPARPGEPQHGWEPSRILRRAQSGVGVDPDGLPPGLVRHRRRALEALGNAVVPQVAEVIAWRVLELAERIEAA